MACVSLRRCITHLTCGREALRLTVRVLRLSLGGAVDYLNVDHGVRWSYCDAACSSRFFWFRYPRQLQKVLVTVLCGLALGYCRALIPVGSLGISILVAHAVCAMFGVALEASDLFGRATLALTCFLFALFENGPTFLTAQETLQAMACQRELRFCYGLYGRHQGDATSLACSSRKMVSP